MRNAWPNTTFAVLRPTPGSFVSASIEAGISPPCWSITAVAMPSRLRVFILKKVYGLPQKEIAARLNISESTVEKQAAKGLFVCAEFMAEMFAEPQALLAIEVGFSQNEVGVSLFADAAGNVPLGDIILVDEETFTADDLPADKARKLVFYCGGPG